jgi:tetratricopeptide (TPR) repeat protein
MTPTYESSADLLREGAAALKAGDRAGAMSLLARAVRSDPRNELAWLYLAGAVSDLAQRRTCLERVLSLNPQNEAALRGLRSLTPAAPSPAAPVPGPPMSPPPPAAPPSIPVHSPPPVADRIMSLLAAEPAPPPPAPAPTRLLPPEPAPPAAPEPATSTTMRLPAVPLPLAPQAGARRRRGDRVVWALVLALGVMLMLGGAAYAIILLRG